MAPNTMLKNFKLPHLLKLVVYLKLLCRSIIILYISSISLIVEVASMVTTISYFHSIKIYENRWFYLMMISENISISFKKSLQHTSQRKYISSEYIETLEICRHFFNFFSVDISFRLEAIT